MDATATALVAASAKLDDRIEGVNLVPYLTGDQHRPGPHDQLYWRWSGQYAIRAKNRKYLKAGEREYLFDLTTEEHEAKNLIHAFPQVAEDLKSRLTLWSEAQHEPGFDHQIGYSGERFLDYYLDDKPSEL